MRSTVRLRDMGSSFRTREKKKEIERNDCVLHVVLLQISTCVLPGFYTAVGIELVYSLLSTIAHFI